MCSPFSVSERVTRCATSLTFSATRSPTEVMSCDRSRCTLPIALRTCSDWLTSVSRWLVSSLEQIADADFVVVIGALERGDFVVDEGFEFGGARQRALDAVAHRRDFAADGLSDRDDLFARRGFRLRQTHGDFGHGLGDEAHVLRAANMCASAKEDGDRHDDGRGCAR